MQLNKIQQYFKDHMFDEVTAVENPQEAFSDLFSVGNIPLETRLKIYRNHIVTTLSEVLVMNFSLVEILTGTDFLKTAAKLYLFDNPPTEACLDRYGEGFSDFLTSYKHANHLPYLSDIAKLDWAMNESRTAKNDDTLQREDLADIPPKSYESAVFQLKKSVRLLYSPFPLDKIYRFCEEQSEENILDVSPEDNYILITRLGWEPKIFKLDKPEYEFFIMLQNKEKLGMALETILNTYPNFNFAEFLQNYIDLETFSNVVTN